MWNQVSKIVALKPEVKSSKEKKATRDSIDKIGVSSHHWICCKGEDIQMVSESESITSYMAMC